MTTVAPPLRSEPLQQPDLAQRHAYEVPSDVMAFDLTPGDVLYVPRGAWHEPVTLEGPSLHLTITLPHWTPLDVLRWMGSRLEREAPMRREFALHPEQGRTDEAVQQQLTEALNQIAELASDEDAVRRYVLDTFTHHASRYSEDQDVPVVEER